MINGSLVLLPLFQYHILYTLSCTFIRSLIPLWCPGILFLSALFLRLNHASTTTQNMNQYSQHSLVLPFCVFTDTPGNPHLIVEKQRTSVIGAPGYQSSPSVWPRCSPRLWQRQCFGRRYSIKRQNKSKEAICTSLDLPSQACIITMAKYNLTLCLIGSIPAPNNGERGLDSLTKQTKDWREKQVRAKIAGNQKYRPEDSPDQRAILDFNKERQPFFVPAFNDPTGCQLMCSSEKQDP